MSNSKKYNTRKRDSSGTPKYLESELHDEAEFDLQYFDTQLPLKQTKNKKPKKEEVFNKNF